MATHFTPWATVDLDAVAGKLLDMEEVDCAHGDCNTLETLSRDLIGQTYTYETTNGIDTRAEPNHWIRREVWITTELAQQAVTRAREIAAEREEGRLAGTSPRG